MAQDIAALPMLKDLLIGTNKRKMVSTTVLLIIAFLIHVRNKKSDLEFLPVREKKEHKKKVRIISCRVARATSMPSFGRALRN